MTQEGTMIEEETTCQDPDNILGQHCDCWYEGHACCFCGEGELERDYDETED